MSETGQPSAALWETLPSERQRTVLLMFAQIIRRRVRKGRGSGISARIDDAQNCVARRHYV
jgi:hypothetical protein